MRERERYSGPLSHLIALGLPRHSISCSNDLITLCADKE